MRNRITLLFFALAAALVAFISDNTFAAKEAVRFVVKPATHDERKLDFQKLDQSNPEYVVEIATNYSDWRLFIRRIKIGSTSEVLAGKVSTTPPEKPTYQLQIIGYKAKPKPKPDPKVKPTAQQRGNCLACHGGFGGGGGGVPQGAGGQKNPDDGGSGGADGAGNNGPDGATSGGADGVGGKGDDPDPPDREPDGTPPATSETGGVATSTAKAKTATLMFRELPEIPTDELLADTRYELGPFVGAEQGVKFSSSKSKEYAVYIGVPDPDDYGRLTFYLPQGKKKR